MTTVRRGPLAPTFGSWLIIAGLLGLLAAFELTIEKFHALTNPGEGAACDFSVIVQCSANLQSAQGAVFGFPNPIIGLVSWPLVIAMGLLVLARVELPRWWWYGFLGGFVGAVVFISWLQYQSIMVLGTLCPWCMVTWFAVMPAFVALLNHMGRLGHFGERFISVFGALKPYTVLISLLWIIGIATWAQLRLNWIGNVFLI